MKEVKLTIIATGPDKFRMAKNIYMLLTNAELCQAIPPAYALFLGKQVIRYLEAAK